MENIGGEGGVDGGAGVGLMRRPSKEVGKCVFAEREVNVRAIRKTKAGWRTFFPSCSVEVNKTDYYNIPY